MLRPLGVVLVMGAVAACSSLTGLTGFGECSGTQCDAGINANVHPDGTASTGAPDATTPTEAGEADETGMVSTDDAADGGETDGGETDALEEGDGEDCDGA